ncbi:MAG: GDYXXLXY domain-containing protein, partial [Chryseolinea sp.]
GRMIYQSEDVILSGTLYKFETEPVDPSDPFRGKYIVLNFKEDVVEDSIKSTGAEWSSGETAFVRFGIDSDGFAHAIKILKVAPSDGDYLTTKVLYSDSDLDHIDTVTAKINNSIVTTVQKRARVHFSIPFNRLYLEESKAQPAEEQYRISQRDSTSTTYGLVRMGKGQAVLVDVMIDGKSIVDVVRELN